MEGTGREERGVAGTGPEAAAEEQQAARFVFKGRVFYFLTRWEPEAFDVIVTDGKNVWEGGADAETVRRELCPEALEVARYVDLVRQSFAHQEGNDVGRVLLGQGRGPQEARVTWRIALPQQAGAALRGRLQLRLAERGQTHVQGLLDHLLAARDTARASAAASAAAVARLTKDAAAAAHSLDKLVRDKQGLEADMYSKFVLVLNEKKRAIQSLKQQLEESRGREASRAEPSASTAVTSGTGVAKGTTGRCSTSAGARGEGRMQGVEQHRAIVAEEADVWDDSGSLDMSATMGRAERSDALAALHDLSDGSSSSEPTQGMQEDEVESLTLTPPQRSTAMRRIASPTDRLLDDFDAFVVQQESQEVRRKRSKRMSMKRSASSRAGEQLLDAALARASKRRKTILDEEEVVRPQHVEDADASDLFEQASF